MFLLIDNYDSFTYNLVQAFYALGQDPVVVKNDDPRLLELAQDPSLNMVCLSPGPGHPKDAGYCMEVLRILDPKVPVLGVCLGHQALGDARRENSPPGGVITLSKSLLHIRQQNYKNEGRGKNPSPCFHALRRCLVKAGSHVAARSSCGTARGLSPPARRETA